jgi:hypothetical protein
MAVLIRDVRELDTRKPAPFSSAGRQEQAIHENDHIRYIANINTYTYIADVPFVGYGYENENQSQLGVGARVAKGKLPILRQSNSEEQDLRRQASFAEKRAKSGTKQAKTT